MRFKNLSRQLEAGPVQCQRGVCAIDIDDDGLCEAYICAHDGPNLLLDFNDGVYRLFLLPQLSDAAASSQSAVACDVNADGLEELYVHNISDETVAVPSSDRLFARHGLGWVDLFNHETNQSLRNRVSGHSLAVIDRLGNGSYGIIVQNHSPAGPLQLYEIEDQHEEKLHDVAADTGIQVLTDGTAMLAAPLFGHTMDLLIGGTEDLDRIFVAEQNGHFNELPATQGLGKTGHSASLCLVDDPRYGICCIVVRHSQDSRMYRLDKGKFVLVQCPGLEDIISPHNVVAADFDNNGYQEIYVTTTAGRNHLFAWRDGTWTEVDPGILSEPGGSCSGVCVADFNGDGCLEVLVTHGERGAQPLSLYEHEDTPNTWIRIMPLTQYYAPARGSLVTITAGGRRQTRVIDAGSSTLCQMEPIAHFGLGDAQRVEEVVVTWPDGRTQCVNDLNVNTIYKVTYPNEENVEKKHGVD
ncbi:CRTAC1 family protein [Desulfovibrio inopinatus]|uniref:CRTAC1 family protein n=1 Tax=Desulfovibrio inopinatus TaxID=102109 RepID=UPI00040386B8|nr:CRTAC1 family protein [Desulfovibrio inopinatus]